jgi:pyroglutamyl-peptidase
VPILVTGFEPFAGSALNPSQLIVAALAESSLAENLVLEVLPVEYDRAGKKLRQLITQHDPHTVICIGQAEGRASISIETRAQNLDDANLADNSGETRSGQPISSDGKAELPTTLPVDALLEQLALAGRSCLPTPMCGRASFTFRWCLSKHPSFLANRPCRSKLRWKPSQLS